MAGEVATRTGVWIAAESTEGTDPSANGSGYTAVPTLEPAYPSGGNEALTTDFATERGFPTATEVGADSGALTIKVPFRGLNSSVGDGIDASTIDTDYLDLLLACPFGAAATTVGDDVAGTPAAGTIQLTNDALSALDLVALVATGATNIQYRSLGTLATTYPVDRNWTTTPTVADICYGSKLTRWTATSADGSSLAAVVEVDGIFTTLLGGRVNAAKIVMPPKGIAYVEIGLIFDSRTVNDTAKSALPDHQKTFYTGAKGMLAPVAFNGTAYPTAQVEIDLLPATTEVMSTAGTNGRSGIMTLATAPTVTIKPAYATAWETSFDAGTTGPVSVQIGSGVVVTNTAATTAVSVTSNVATATVAQGHGFVAGMEITTSGHTTNATTPVTITSVTSTTIVYPLTTCDGAMADGVGTISHSRVNAGCFYAQAAQVQADPATENDNGYARKSVTLRVVDAGVFTGSTLHHLWTLART